jgi:hypothetical protein
MQDYLNLDWDFEIDHVKAEAKVAELYQPLLRNLPSRFEPEFRSFLESFVARKIYIQHFGFVALSRELMVDIRNKLEALGIKNFLELQAGTGFFTKVLNDYGFIGKGITLEIPEEGHHWGLTRSPIYDYCVTHNLLEFEDLENIVGHSIPELVISSWIPYEHGDEIIKFFKWNNLPEYYLVIGEGEGGCTANDNYFKWLENNFEMIHLFEEYKSFFAIHDTMVLYKLKEKK